MNEIINNMDALMQIAEAIAFIFLGWVAKWMQRNQIDNQKKNK